jgi:type I restriction enzyme S subunit
MVRLGDLFDFKNGRSFKKTEWKEVGLPIIRIQNLNKVGAGFNFFDGEYDPAIEVNKNDLLFSWSGTVGSSFGPHIWQRDTGVLNQHIFKISFKTDMLLKYAFYSLLFITEEIERSVVGAVGLVHVTKKSLNEFKIPEPPIPEQKRIVAILDQAFEDIEDARAKTEQNLKNARELFDSYLQKIFSQRGEGWESAKLKDICTKVTDGVHKKPNYIDEGVAFLKINNLTAGAGISFENISYISRDDHELFCKRTNPEKGDILISKDGTIGIVRIIDTDIEFSIFVSLALVKPIDKSISNYLKFVLESPDIQGQIKPQGTALKHLYLRDLREFIIPIAPSSKRVEIVEKLDKMLIKVELLEKIYQRKLNVLDELKKSILQKAFSGELTKNKEGAAA